MVSHLLDEALLVKVSEHFSSNSSINLELIADNGNSDNLELGYFLGDSLVSLGIEEDSIVELFLYLDLGPTLLLCLSTFLVCRCGSGLGALVALSALGVFSLLLLWALKT